MNDRERSYSARPVKCPHDDAFNTTSNPTFNQVTAKTENNSLKDFDCTIATIRSLINAARSKAELMTARDCLIAEIATRGRMARQKATGYN